MNHVRLVNALVLAVCAGGLGAGCRQTVPPCTQLAPLEARYAAELVAGCSSAASLAECPDFAAIKARHNARMKEASCRY